jgi:hypothetical protein
VSLTVTVNVQVAPPLGPFALARLSEQVTVVVPTVKVLPEVGEQVTVPQVPVVVGGG